MYTPGEIRAAEYVNSRDVCGTAGDDHDVDRQWTDSAGIVAATILRHRADYDSDDSGPRPLSEEFCLEMGLSPGTSLSGNRIYFKGMGISTLIWTIGAQVMHFGGVTMAATRPQLRALIEVMG